ncbi:MAG TPA: SUMF1/EgtB/PvdO family nonheme iron enzyme [Bacteroidia bacterium]|nr:SUMF1/EgtB/PvdO family nonheme iron enzyme [Bacteroidia bacterium]
MKAKKIVALFFIASVLFGCFLTREQYDVVRKTPKLKYETPPGCVWLHDNIFIDETEVTNLDYIEFLYWENRKDPEKYKAMLPDTLVWRDSSMFNEPYVNYYLRHPAYRDYPVVGISYEQAVAFCKWRSDRVNEFIYIRERKVKWSPDSTYHFREVMRFRLPTKEEWEYAAAAGLNQDEYPYGYEKLIDKNGLPVSNTIEFGNLYNNTERFKYDYSAGRINDASDITTPVFAFSPNKYGIYNMTGNVSEIIADTLFKGLNFSTSLDGTTFANRPHEYVRTDSIPYNYDNRFTFRYQKPQSWLGFRCVCEVLKELGSKY